MANHMYKIGTEIETIATKRAGDELREIADQLEMTLYTFLSGCNGPISIESYCNTINHNDNSISSTCTKEDTFSEGNEETSKSNNQTTFTEANCSTAN